MKKNMKVQFVPKIRRKFLHVHFSDNLHFGQYNTCYCPYFVLTIKLFQNRLSHAVK
jgi:hypothetical protein